MLQRQRIRDRPICSPVIPNVPRPVTVWQRSVSGEVVANLKTVMTGRTAALSFVSQRVFNYTNHEIMSFRISVVNNIQSGALALKYSSLL
jgi:hypothetical protein